MTRQKCPECGEEETVYRTRDRQKCAVCDWSRKPKMVSQNVPTRKIGMKCGEIFGPPREKSTKPCLRKRMCSDNSNCSINGKGIEQIAPEAWIVVCHTHRKNATD